MIEINKATVQIGIAPIGWTNDDLPALGGDNTFKQCVSEMALAGYAGCEIGNKFPRDVNVLKKELAMRKLQVTNGWFSTFFTTRPAQETIARFIKHRDFLHELGAKVIGVSEQGLSIQNDQRQSLFKAKPIFTNRQWAFLASGLEKLALLCKEQKMKLAFHHHMGTGVQTEEEIDQLMQRTSKKVHLLIDTGHLYLATHSQLAVQRVTQKHINRTAHIHLKDVRETVLATTKQRGYSFLTAVKKGVFTIPGDGVIKYEPFFEIVAKSKYQGWIIVEAEQDPAKANPLEYALRARNFIKQKTGL